MEKFGSMNRWLQVFVGVGTVAAVAEFADGFRIEFPVAAWIFAALMAAAVAWTWWGKAGGRVGGPIVAILLQVMELAGVAFTYARPVSAVETAIYWFFGVLTVACIVAAVGTLVSHLRAHKAQTASPT